MMRIAFLFCLAGLVLGPVPAADAQIETLRLRPDDTVEAALRALADGRIDRALAIAERTLREARRLRRGPAADAAALKGHTLACICHRLERAFTAAASHCDAVVALAPDDWRGYVNRGALHFDAGDIAAARADFEAAAALEPGEPAVVANLALVRE